MTYEVRWDKKVQDFLRKLDRGIAARIVRKVDEAAHDPLRYIEPLVS